MQYRLDCDNLVSEQQFFSNPSRVRQALRAQIVKTMGTALARSESETDLCLKASAFEISAWPVDGMDVLAVENATRRAAIAVRSGGAAFCRVPHVPLSRTFDVRSGALPR